MSWLVWILGSLIAISLIGDYPNVALVLTGLAGIAFGLAAVLEAQNVQSRSAIPSSPPSLTATRLLNWVVANELWILLLVGPLFLFPRRTFLPVFVLVPVLWILRWRVHGWLIRRTPLDVPEVCLIVMLGVSVLVSADLDRSFPKLAGIVWGIAVFYALISYIRSQQDVEWITIGIAAIGAGVAVVALLGTEWITSGKLLPSQVYALLPRGLTNIPGTIGGLIHPNEAGGSLAFIVPFLFAFVEMQWNVRRGPEKLARLVRLRTFLVGKALVIPLGITAIVLVLTQSRSALFGVAVSVGLFFAIRYRVFRWLAAIGLGVFTFLLVTRGPALIEIVLIGSGGQGGVAGNLDFAGRQEVWSRALYAMQDFPFTGVGLNMFDPVSKVLYPYFLVSPDAVLAHAHNMYLQMAMDLGIPGLVAYLALLTGFGYMVCKVYVTSSSAFTRAVALALGLGVLAHQIFGLTDAITLGAKPGIILWVMLAVAAGLWILTRSAMASDPAMPQGGQP